MNEPDLERIARSAGHAEAERLDVERVANAVVARLRAQPVGARPLWWRSALLRVAATLAVLAGGALGIRSLVDRSAEGRGAVIPDLTDLSAAQLVEISDSLNLEMPLHENVAVGLHDLTEEQLQELLRLMEG